MKKIYPVILIFCIIGFYNSCSRKASPEDMKYSRFLLNEAIKYESLGNMEEAEKNYKSSIEKNPQNREAQLRLDSFYMAGKKYEQAIAIVKNSSAEKCWKETRLGIICMSKGDEKAAMSHFESAIKSSKDFPTPYYYLGVLLLNKGDKKKSKEHFEEYEAIFLKSPYRRSEENFLPDAEKALISIQYPEESSAYLEALKYYNEDSLQKSEKLLSGLTSPPALVLRARLLRGNNKEREAFELLKKAGDYLPAQILMIEMLHAKGDNKNVKTAHEMAVTILGHDPESQNANFLLARILMDTGKEDEAKKYFQKAANYGSDDLIAMEANKYLSISSPAMKGLSTIVDEYEKLAVKNSNLLPKLDSIMKKLVASSRTDSSGMVLKLKIYKGNRNEINALSIREEDTGYIYVSENLVSFVNSLPLNAKLKDSIYAVIIGHELTHILEKHSQQSFSLTGVLKSESLIAGVEEKETARTAQNQAHEFEADRIGSMNAYMAGYNPFMMKQFYSDLIKSKGDIPKNMDHPTFRERVNKLNENFVEMKLAYVYFRKGVGALSPKKKENADEASARLDQADKYFRVFLGTFTDNAPALSNMGLVYLQKALVGTARQKYSYATSISISPGFVDPSDLEGRSQRRSRGTRKATANTVNKEILAKAEKYYIKALRTDGNNACVWNNLGIIYAYQEKYTEAMKAFERAIAIDSKNLQAKNNIGVCKINRGNKTEGIKLIEEARSKGLKI